VLRRDVTSFYAVFYGVMLLGTSYVSQLRFLLPLLPVHALWVRLLSGRRLSPYVVAALAGLQILITRMYLDWQFVI